MPLCHSGMFPAGIQSLHWPGFRLRDFRNDVGVFENMCSGTSVAGGAENIVPRRVDPKQVNSLSPRGSFEVGPFPHDPPLGAVFVPMSPLVDVLGRASDPRPITPQ